MTDERIDNELPGDADRRLDRLLEDWAGHMRLTPREQDDIYDHIFIVSEDLGYDWWRRLFDQFPFKPASGFPGIR